MLFEHTGEVLRIVEAKQVGGFGDGEALQKDGLRPLHDETADVGGGRTARQFAGEVAEIVRREEQLLGAVFHRGQALLTLQALVIILIFGCKVSQNLVNFVILYRITTIIKHI